jgi:hypothetical protein
MSPRAKKFVGLIGILAFLAAYVLLASKLGDLVPDLWWARLIYYAVVGTLWGVPLFPLIRWMNREG